MIKSSYMIQPSFTTTVSIIYEELLLEF
jgi:hypothetical protein